MRAILFLLLAVGALAETKWDSAGKLWWSHVRFLADDNLEGRNVGSAGYEAAADYVVSRFKDAGLEAGAHSGYSQPVGFTKVTLDEAASQLTLVRGETPVPVRLGDEALITSTANVSGIEAPLVFAGYGLDIPEAGYSDLKDAALNGAIAVYLAGGPASISSELRAHHSSGAERGAAMKAVGVIGTISIPNPRSMDIPWVRQSANRLLPRMVLADQVFAAQPAISFSITWNPEKTDALFEGSGYSIAGILDAADHDRPLPHFALKTKLRVRIATRRDSIESRNIVGIRRGLGSASEAGVRDSFGSPGPPGNG